MFRTSEFTASNELAEDTQAQRDFQKLMQQASPANRFANDLNGTQTGEYNNPSTWELV